MHSLNKDIFRSTYIRKTWEPKWKSDFFLLSVFPFPLHFHKYLEQSRGRPLASRCSYSIKRYFLLSIFFTSTKNVVVFEQIMLQKCVHTFWNLPFYKFFLALISTSLDFLKGMCLFESEVKVVGLYMSTFHNFSHLTCSYYT